MKYFLPGFRAKNLLDVKITWTYVNEKYHFDIFLSNIIFVSYQWILCVWWMKPFVYNPTIKVNKHYTYFPFVHISWWVFDDTESLERFSFTNINRKGFDVLFPADDFGFEGKCDHWRVYKLNWKNVEMCNSNKPNLLPAEYYAVHIMPSVARRTWSRVSVWEVFPSKISNPKMFLIWSGLVHTDECWYEEEENYPYVFEDCQTSLSVGAFLRESAKSRNQSISDCCVNYLAVVLLLQITTV